MKGGKCIFQVVHILRARIEHQSSEIIIVILTKAAVREALVTLAPVEPSVPEMASTLPAMGLTIVT